MSNVSSDAIALTITEEQAGDPIGTLGGSEVWERLQPNSIASFGNKNKTVAREPIDPNLMTEKGKLVDRDSGIGFNADITFGLLHRMLPRALNAKYQNKPDKGPQYGAPYRPTSVTSTAYIVDALGDLPQGTLIYATGFAIAGNNGFKVVGAASDGTHVKTSGLAAETVDVPDQNAMVFVVGVQGGSADITITVSGGVTTLGSTVLDFTKLGLSEGQLIFIGGDDSNTFFATAGDNTYGRIAAGGLAAHAVILEKLGATTVTDAGTGKTIQLFFGPFIHGVPTDDDEFNEFLGFQAEMQWTGLDSGDPLWSYAVANYVNTSAWTFPISNKGEVTFTCVGKITESPVDTQKAGANAPRTPRFTDSFNTSSEITRLRVTELDETGMTSDFLSATLNINNNASMKKTLAFLGGKYAVRGRRIETLEADILLTSPAIWEALDANDTVTAELGFMNSLNQGFIVDFPELTLDDGSPSFPAHDLVQLKCSLKIHRSEAFGYMSSFSLFPYLPELARPASS